MISILEFQLKEQYGSLDGPDVVFLLMNFDEVDIPLFLNSRYFCRKHISFV